MKQTPKEILDALLGSLGFTARIEEVRDEYGLTLQVYTDEKDPLTGSGGRCIDDLQYLLNRILLLQDPESAKVQVDVEHFRSQRNDALIARVRSLAETVRETGNPFHLEPMNAYDRRVVHHAFRDDPDILTVSPQDDARIKRITLKKR